MPTLAHPGRIRPWVVALLVAACSSAAHAIQDVTPSPAVPGKREAVPADENTRQRPPLLREGGYLVRTPGEVTEDARLGVHRFQPLHVEDGGVRRELILLPSRAMDDLLEILGSDDASGSGLFEITGKVLVYRGRNFLLPDVLTMMDQPASKVREELEPDALGAAPRQEEMALDTDSDDLAREIEARLEARIGAVPRSVNIAREETPRPTTPLHRAGTNLQNRRGHVLRDPSSGTWRFVLEGSSLTMELLPCLELERMERTTRQRVVPVAVSVSGRVTIFHGRNYLLPTAFATAREGRGIGP